VVVEATEQAVVEARGLTKVFKDFWGRPKARAVNGVDLTVRRGQVFGLLGPNGSGKSTTVKMILGLLYPTRGKLEVLGESPRRVETKRRIGYLPEDSYLYRYLTAGESLDFFGALFGIPAEERRRRCDQLLEMVGLSSARARPVGEFSKGMARRIGLAQALINDPEVVILDEPTSGLDPIGCREVKDVIKLLAGRGKTVVLCSHLLADVEDVCDQVVVLYGGRVCAEGSLRDMLRIQGRTRIVAPLIEQDVLQRVTRMLEESVPGQNIEVDNPSMNLEEFFLEVVRRAREDSLETAGAQAGGEIAAYLREASTPAAAAAHGEILSALSAAPPAPESEAILSAESPEPVPAPTDNATLKALAEADLVEDTAEEIEETRESPGAGSAAKASGRLKDLLGDSSPQRKQ